LIKRASTCVVSRSSAALCERRVVSITSSGETGGSYREPIPVKFGKLPTLAAAYNPLQSRLSQVVRSADTNISMNLESPIIERASSRCTTSGEMSAATTVIPASFNIRATSAVLRMFSARPAWLKSRSLHKPLRSVSPSRMNTLRRCSVRRLFNPLARVDLPAPLSPVNHIVAACIMVTNTKKFTTDSQRVARSSL